MTLTFDPRNSIDRAFQHLTRRLEPIVASTLAPHVGPLPWTVILEELDRQRGKAPGTYAASDPQAQLRVLTERLGSIGFPFDDHTRTVSVLGGELRISRNRWAHHGDLDALDAWRTNDFVVRLLDRLGDAEGAHEAVVLRDEAFDAVAQEKGTAAHAAPAVGADVDAPIADASFALPTSGSVPDVARSSFALIEPPAPAPRLDFGAVRDEVESSNNAKNDVSAAIHTESFDPWPVVAVGGREIIEGLPRKAMKEQVRAVAAEIVDYEGPIQLKRLTQLTAASFGIRRLHDAKERKIAYQIQRMEGIIVDADKFAWPEGVDPSTWRGFRSNGSEIRRDLTVISPVEIANAMRHLRAQGEVLPEDEEARAVLRIFGRSRLTPAFRTHLGRARRILSESDRA